MCLVTNLVDRLAFSHIFPQVYQSNSMLYLWVFGSSSSALNPTSYLHSLSSCGPISLRGLCSNIMVWHCGGHTQSLDTSGISSSFLSSLPRANPESALFQGMNQTSVPALRTNTPIGLGMISYPHRLYPWIEILPPKPQYPTESTAMASPPACYTP